MYVPLFVCSMLNQSCLDKQALYGGLKNRFSHECVHSSGECFVFVGILSVGRKTTDVWRRLIGSFFLQKTFDTRCSFHTIKNWHLKLHQYQVIRSISLSVEFLDERDSFFAVRCRIRFDLILLEHGCDSDYVIEVVINN